MWTLFLILYLAPRPLLASPTLNGAHLKIAGAGFAPFLKFSGGKNGFPGGIDMDIVSILAKKLNFTYEFCATDTWGFVKEGVWIGTVGEVLNHSSDIGIGHMIITHSRISAVDMSTPLYAIKLKFLTRKPLPLPQYFNVIKPFTKTSWLAIALSLLAMPILQTILSGGFIVESNGYVNKAEAALLLLGSFTGQPMGDGRKIWGLVSGYLFLTSAFFFATLIIMSYECNLRAYLMSVDYEQPVDTAKDLVLQNRYLHVVRGATYENFLKQSKSPYLTALYKVIVERNLYYPPSGILPRMMETIIVDTGAAILLTESMILANTPGIINRFGYNPFRLGRDAFSLSFSGFAFSRNTSMLQVFDPLFHRLKDHGIIQKIFTDNLPQLSNQDATFNHEEPLGMKHILFANIIWVVALGISTICFLMEYLPSKNHLKRSLKSGK